MIIFTRLLSLCFVFLSSLAWTENIADTTKDLPIAWNGRFCSLDSATRLWLYDIYHKQELQKKDLMAFDVDDRSALDLLWQIHFYGHNRWDDAPFFWVHYAQVKSLLGFDLSTDRFTYNQIKKALTADKDTNLPAVKLLIANAFAKEYFSAANRTRSDKIELRSLSIGLWAMLHNDALIIVAAPTTPPWHHLTAGMPLLTNFSDLSHSLQSGNKKIVDELLQLFQQMQTYSDYRGSQSTEDDSYVAMHYQLQKQGVPAAEIKQKLEAQFPLATRLKNAGTTLKMLPLRTSPGEWVSLHAFGTMSYDATQRKLVPVDNFTSFTDDDYNRLRDSYLSLEAAHQKKLPPELVAPAYANFSKEYTTAYTTIAGLPYKTAEGKTLVYPCVSRLKAETLYYRLPIIEVTILAYGLALLLMIAGTKTPNRRFDFWALTFLSFGLILHTAVLVFRCYILQRPPVSNMFETIIYVPWIAVITGLIFYIVTRSRAVIAAATLASLALLVLLKITQVDARMENVQAVLDSQYWLIIHVLMVVGSYGAFAVCGILAHFYLISSSFKKTEPNAQARMAKGILHTMYVGVALLIPGTILGGVWAAESWGRFWDWDPKESWAFISACVYLVVIHAYIFERIRDFGLAVGAIGGLIAISFTWYGVNYVLGTGLHSYGFGKGGEMFYFLYLAAEMAFLVIVSTVKYKRASLHSNQKSR